MIDPDSISDLHLTRRIDSVSLSSGDKSALILIVEEERDECFDKICWAKLT